MHVLTRYPTKYQGRRAALATEHAKERAVARPLCAGLGLEVVLDQLRAYGGLDRG